MLVAFTSTLGGEVTERFVEHGANVIAGLSRQRADVDLELDPVGDDIGLGAGSHHGGRERGVRAGMRLAGQPDHRELGNEVVEAVGVEQRVGQFGGKLHPFDKAAPDVVDLRLGPILGDSADYLGRLDERVVRPQRRRCVPGGPSDDQAAPERALLTDDHGQLRAAPGRHRNPAGLGDDVVSRDGISLVLREPCRPVVPERLLVGHGQVDQRAAWSEALGRQLPGGHGHRGGEVQHVDGAPTPYLAVHQLTAEGVPPPPVGVGGHDVGVAHKQEGGCRGVGSLDPPDQGGAPRLGLVGLDIEASSAQVRAQDIHAANLLPRRGGAVVYTGISDQLLKEIRDLGGHVGSHDGHRKA